MDAIAIPPESLKHLNELIIQGETLKAMELYYAENVTMQENTEIPRKGKAVCLAQEKQNRSKTHSLHCTLISQEVDTQKGCVRSVWEFEYTTHEAETYRLREISIQYWEKGTVLQEQFIYDRPELI